MFPLFVLLLPLLQLIQCCVDQTCFQTSSDNTSLGSASTQHLDQHLDSAASVTFLSESSFTGGVATTIQWNVTGIISENLHVQCNTTNYTTSNASSTLSVTFTSDDDIILCTVYNLTSPIFSTTLYRVGWNCSAGEYGNMELQCLTCDLGYTSTAGSDTCYHGNSSCHPGQYGLGDNCSLCPWGLTSVNQSVKIQDCYKPFDKPCHLNYYFNQTSCLLCPFGYISQPGAGKLHDCVQASSHCQENCYESAGSECSVCPDGTISGPGGSKVEDCVPRNSTCVTGEYGVDTCKQCPWGTTSGGVVKVEECYTPSGNCSTDHYITQNCTACQGDCDGCLATMCVPCPANYTSIPGAAKLQDCRVRCPAGWYSSPHSNNTVLESRGSTYTTPVTPCVRCPNDTTSPVGSTSLSDCHATGPSAQVLFFIGVLVVMVMLGLVMVGTIVRYHFKRQYKARRLREFFEKQRNVHGTYIIQSKGAIGEDSGVFDL